MIRPGTITLLALLLLAIRGGAGESAGEPVGRSGWQVVATSAGDREIDVIKAIREVTGLGLRDSKDLADGVPVVVLSTTTEHEARAAANRLREAGMTVEVRSE